MSNTLYRILLVEDNAADAYLLRKALTDAAVDFELHVLEDGASAVAHIRENSTPLPHLAVLDLNMPGMDGVELLELLRRNERFRDVPVVITTSSAAPSDRIRAEQLRVQRFLTKPLDLDGFLKLGLILKEVLSTSALPPS